MQMRSQRFYSADMANSKLDYWSFRPPAGRFTEPYIRPLHVNLAILASLLYSTAKVSFPTSPD